MKKLLVISLFILNLSSFSSLIQAQYTVLANFAGTNGAGPHGSLTQIGKNLYGMAGGGSGYGVIFSIDTNGSVFNDIFLASNAIDCSSNYNGLIFTENKFYGMTENGGTNEIGSIFSIDTNGTAYRDLFNFAGYNGEHPFGKLTLYRSTLYGMTYNGTLPNQYGNIFSIDSDGRNFRILLNFNDTNGSEPRGDLTLVRNKLYGMTSMGGEYASGVIFSIDTNGSNYRDLLDFNGTNGSSPFGSLTVLGKVLYGMTEDGGTYGLGTIFSIDTNGSNYRDLLDFNGTNGLGPTGSLIVSGDYLFGMALEGGLNNDGCIFYIDTNGAGYRDLYNFNGTDGKYPDGDLTLFGSALYGMTGGGGTISDGVIFKLDTTNISTSVNQILVADNQLSVYPNPNNGIFTLSISHSMLIEGSQTIEIYNVLGEQVYHSTTQPQTPVHTGTGGPSGALSKINLTGQPSGVYFYRVINESGGLLSEGKVIIVK